MVMSTWCVSGVPVETHGVDLIMHGGVGAPFPAGNYLPRRPRPGLPRDSPVRDDPHPVDVAGLGSLPNPVVAVTAVLGALARQFTTRRSRWVPLDRLWSRCTPRTVTTDAHVEINSGFEAMIGEVGT
jgi:hypothetical protein